jgi:FkbM family methyltransferase
VGRLVAAVCRDRIRSRGFIFDTTSHVVHPSTKAELFWRFYESAEIRFVERYLSARRDVVELGSSLGVVSCHVKRRIGPARRLICVEANPALVPVIVRNLKLNGLHQKVQVVNRAICYNELRWGFVPGLVTTDGRLKTGDQANRVPVGSTTLTALLREFGIHEYALVCDIEGAELEILRRDSEAFRNCHEMIIEMHKVDEGAETTKVDDLQKLFTERLGMSLRARHGAVGYFSRSVA